MTRPQFTRKELIGNNNTGNSTVGVNGDGSLNVQSTILAYNGSSSDRIYNNTQGTLLASSARTATVNSPQITNYNADSVIIFVNITVASGTGGLSLYFQGIDPVTGLAFTIAPQGSLLTTTGGKAYLFGKGVTGSGVNIDKSNSVPIPRIFQVMMSHGDSSSYTYSVGYSLIN